MTGSLDDLLTEAREQSGAPQAGKNEGPGVVSATSLANSLVPPLETGNNAVSLQRVRYTHDAMIDILLANPAVSQNELAETFGYTVSWVSTVLNSDSFQTRLSQRRTALVGSSLLMNFNERMRKLAFKSMGLLEKALDDSMEKNEPLVGPALEIVKVAAKGYGYGGGGVNTVNINNTQTNQQINNVVMVPGKASSAADWARAYGADTGGLEAQLSEQIAVPPVPPVLEALAVTQAMDTTPPLVPVGHHAQE